MQSQPNHVEIIGEKNTVASILSPIAAEYTIPLTLGRGYCSLPPRYDMAKRYRQSGKEKLTLLVVSDHDPEGDDIAHSFARSMRDDFGVELVCHRVALTPEQVEQFKLSPLMEAKESSSRYDKYVSRHGTAVYELEALRPEDLQQILRVAIESAIDGDAYAAEIAAEREDATMLAASRHAMLEAVQGIDLEGDE
jgi:hypothetical protein